MSEEHDVDGPLERDEHINSINRRRFVKALGVAGGTAALGATGGAAAETAPDISGNVERLLTEVGNPTVQSFLTNEFDSDRATSAQSVTIKTSTGNVRYIQKGNKKVGLQFEFSSLEEETRQSIPEKYRSIPSDTQPVLLLNSDGKLVFVREATEKERDNLASATGVDRNDAAMFYNSFVDGFVVETQPRANEDKDADVSSVSVPNDSKDVFLVRPEQVTTDNTSRELHSTSLDTVADYVVDGSTLGTGDAVGEIQPENSFDRATSPLSFSSEPVVGQIEQPTAQSPNCSGPECQCDEGNWSLLCAQSITVCAGCTGVCAGGIASGGLLLAGCLACFGSTCNFALPLSCSLFLECSL
jgi:hypothetical protein